MNERKIPKKSIILISILVLIATFYVIFNKYNLAKIGEFLIQEAGYKNIDNVTVYTSHQVVDKAKKIGGKSYYVKFFNKDTNQVCKGYLIADENGNITNKLQCK